MQCRPPGSSAQVHVLLVLARSLSLCPMLILPEQDSIFDVVRERLKSTVLTAHGRIPDGCCGS